MKIGQQIKFLRPELILKWNFVLGREMIHDQEYSLNAINVLKKPLFIRNFVNIYTYTKYTYICDRDWTYLFDLKKVFFLHFTTDDF